MFNILLSSPIQTFALTCTKPLFLGLVPWYQYLTLSPDSNGQCSIINFDDSSKVLGAQSPFLLIGLAVLDDLIRVAALVAVGFVITGAIQYITSQGSPDAANKARQTIINALIGVVIAIVAATIVSFIGNSLAK